MLLLFLDAFTDTAHGWLGRGGAIARGAWRRGHAWGRGYWNRGGGDIGAGDIGIGEEGISEQGLDKEGVDEGLSEQGMLEEGTGGCIGGEDVVMEFHLRRRICESDPNHSQLSFSLRPSRQARQQ